MKEFVKVQDITKTYKMGEVEIHAVDHISFSIEQGELVVIVGPSGAGKTTVLNILGGMDTATSGKLYVDGKDITAYNSKQLTGYRRDDIGFVFQFYNLVPNLTALENVELALQISKDPLDAQAVLEEVGLGERKNNFPAQLSGGEQQRVSIARALAKNPKLLLCDEPTGALDYNTGKSILKLLQNMCREKGMTVIIITHNLGVVANIAQKIAVMYSGIIVESGTCEDIFYRPRHPYTWALIRSVPRLDLENKQVLASIPGTPPDLLNPPVGCPFCTRCEYCMEICKEQMPEVTEFGDGHEASCWLHHPLAPKVEMPGEA